MFQVFLCKLIDHQAYFALKTMGKKKIIEENDYDSVLMERKIMIYGNQSQFICRLFACFQTKVGVCSDIRGNNSDDYIRLLETLVLCHGILLRW